MSWELIKEMKMGKLKDIYKYEKEFWSDVFGKMGVLVDLMLACKPNHDIDDPDIRWVTDRIEYWQTKDRVLTKDEMLTANLFWKKYGGRHNVMKNG